MFYFVDNDFEESQKINNFSKLQIESVFGQKCMKKYSEAFADYALLHVHVNIKKTVRILDKP